MKVDTLPIGLYEENIYILHDKKQVLIIDPGRNADYIRRFIGPDETVQGILLTHGHDDHVGAADDLAALGKPRMTVGAVLWLEEEDEGRREIDFTKWGVKKRKYKANIQRQRRQKMNYYISRETHIAIHISNPKSDAVIRFFNK